MSIEANKGLIRRYVTDVLDAGNSQLVSEIFTEDCVIHRPERSVPSVGRAHVAHAIAERVVMCSEFRTVIEHLIAEGDLVAARLRHHATYRNDWQGRVARSASAGGSPVWSANVFFRIADGRIAEEWIERDEAGLLQQLGVQPR